jgi:hypothetical protein
MIARSARKQKKKERWEGGRRSDAAREGEQKGEDESFRFKGGGGNTTAVGLAATALITRSQRVDDYVDMAMCMARAQHKEKTRRGGQMSQLLRDVLYSSSDAATDRDTEVVQELQAFLLHIAP